MAYTLVMAAAGYRHVGTMYSWSTFIADANDVAVGYLRTGRDRPRPCCSTA